MKKQLRKGNEAIALAAIYAGCDGFFGYPITPQNELIETMAKHMPLHNRVFVQAESEVAAINMVYGAAGAGALAMTSSSSVGIALKQEGISYCAGAELGCVIVAISRSGPGLGGILPGQADYHQSVKGGGNGDYRVIVLAPNSVQEAVDMVRNAFELSQTYRNPVMVLADGVIGQMMEPVVIDKTPIVRIDKEWAATGDHSKRNHRNIINSLYLNPMELEAHNQKLMKKYQMIADKETQVELVDVEGAEVGIVAYGTPSRIALATMELAKQQGLKVGLIRLKTLWPFPYHELLDATKNMSFVLVAELSMGQLVQDVKGILNNKVKVGFYGRAGGNIFSPEELLEAIIRLQKEPEHDYYI
jgi:2-oxoglutarate ferredoxin oxidoreductase subunit alpha